MVSALLVDALQDPTRALLDLYNDYNSQTSAEGFPSAVYRHFSELFKSPDAFTEIPVLDVQNPPEAHSDRSIARFSAMVQDIFSSPEMYLARRAGGKCGGWGLREGEGEDIGNIEYADFDTCSVLWAVNIPGATSWCLKEIGDTNATESLHAHNPPHPHKFPLPGAAHVGVQIKVYDTSIADTFKVTDIVTFVGILASEPLHLDPELDADVPTLHVLFSRPLPPTVISRPYPANDSALGVTREDLLTWIAKEALGGDRDAAEWLLLSSIARVQSRNPPILPPTLTLSRFPSPTPGSPSTTPTLSHVLSSLFPLSITLPLTLDLLNKDNFIPESKQEDLHSGYLQVPSGTRFLLTESGIREGTLGEKGVTNLKAIQEVMSSQRLSYVFPYSSFEFQADTSFVVLSEGRKSAFFQTTFTIPLVKDDNADLYKPPESVHMPEGEKLTAWRALLGGAMEGKVLVGEDTSKYIQEDFVKQRKDDQSITMDDLIHQMTTARLMALSFHEKEVTVAIWEQTKALYARMKAKAP